MSISRQLNRSGRLTVWRVPVRLLLATAWLAIALAPLPGCGGSSPPAIVEGTLRLNGKPLDNCLVTFLPEPGQEAQGLRSSALTDKDGSFCLRQDDQREGASTGWHRITVQDMSVSTGVIRRDNGKVDEVVEKIAAAPPVRRSRVPQQYMSPKDTPLRRELTAGKQVIELEISVRGSS